MFQMVPVFENEAFVILRLKPRELVLEEKETFPALIAGAVSSGASMVYSDYRLITRSGEIRPNPLIDYLPGALRDDFDFGAFVCVRKADCSVLPETFYELRLGLSVRGGLYHIPKELYSVKEYDPRLSGEKQFDYVDPRNREVQIQREKSVTDFLKRTGLFLPERKRLLEERDLEGYGTEASVVIPVLNRADKVVEAARSALSQRTDFPFNVLAVDNYSSDGTYEALLKLAAEDSRLVPLRPAERGHGIGGCWNVAVQDPHCGKYAVQLDSDDLYSSEDTLQKIVDLFRKERCAMVIGAYQMTDAVLKPIPPGIIDHKEWTDANGQNNALRINGLGAPRAFSTSILRRIGGFPDVSYGEDYAVGLRITREYRLGRIYEPIYCCRRWGGNSDSNLDIFRQNRNNRYKDSVRTAEVLERMFVNQLSSWPAARDRYEALSSVETRTMEVGGLEVSVQYNPARAVSTLAALDRKTLEKRPCFLCEDNRPAEQCRLPLYLGRHGYEIRVNPFPIFPRHFTVVSAVHEAQQLDAGRFTDMLALADIFRNYVIFYNGPACGASAPDHLHFQMGNKGFLPIEKQYVSLRGGRAYLEGAAVLEAADPEEMVQSFLSVSASLGQMLNVLCWKWEGLYVAWIIPRTKHRPSSYFEKEDSRVRISPASVDLGGVFIVPVKEEFDRCDAGLLRKIIHEVVPEKRPVRKQQEISVGLMSEEKVQVRFLAPYHCGDSTVGGLLEVDHLEEDLLFTPVDPEIGTFEVQGVTIGVNFHWQRKENQIFKGALKLMRNEGKILVVNIIGVEDYLHSVISSEMSGKGSLEFLKAHAVISRSWLLARPTLAGGDIRQQQVLSEEESEERHVRWYDRDDHVLFDVCADDHCQRYQGLVRSSDPTVDAAVEQTWGEVLCYDGKICDARFSKCCGGVSERFSTCWAEEDPPYLSPVRDLPQEKENEVPDLTTEEGARKWIMEAPESFCNTSDKALLSKILNSYDTETADFYRWKVVYGQRELSELIHRRSGVDFGTVLELVPLRRGASGRIRELRITGTLRTMVVGKELEIRRFLSGSHLYSSAFVVDRDAEGRFILHGAGWGHGVGLCQIGAAAMGEKGWRYDQILLHYFKHASIEKRY